MNLQTTKPRARYLPGGGKFCLLWEIKHPLTSVSMWASLPHDGAITLLREYVLPRQVEMMREGT
ncbi:hypothetical protein NDK50_08015 [Paraburkholderia bryophila]|uniref:hypothetical protein n=1 Tax=Paraburkholderia bryophila TaxID=420952 RepID=UPI00234A8DE0|nr:hypothetical protein [Paraburkholderia bryophila]WCM21381.1 hypothetical protein NDK50_08015 [Paraburkholderia bryophila]